MALEKVGQGVSGFAAGDMVVSCFFPDWQDGAPTVGDFSRTPGDGIDGFAREHVVLPASAFTQAPKGYDAVEAATITTAGLTAWRALVVNGKLKAGDSVLLLGTGGVSIWALQIARQMGARVAITSWKQGSECTFPKQGSECTLIARNIRGQGHYSGVWEGKVSVTISALESTCDSERTWRCWHWMASRALADGVRLRTGLRGWAQFSGEQEVLHQCAAT